MTVPVSVTPPSLDDYDPTAPHDWGVAGFDLDAYLARIAVSVPEGAAPSAALLEELHTAHVRAIPFENVDVLLGRPCPLGLAALTEKLVHRGRGGYCFEHVPLFAAAAQRLGFAVRRRMARVRPQGSGALTHMLLVVTADDGVDRLVDVGFGASVWRPMPLVDGVEVDQAGWPFRLHAVGSGRWLLRRREGGGWVTDHEFTDDPVRPVDYEVAHHYTATHPDSPFVHRLVVRRLGEGVSTRLLGRELTVWRPDGTSRTSEITPDGLPRVLTDLGVRLGEDELAQVLARF